MFQIGNYSRYPAGSYVIIVYPESNAAQTSMRVSRKILIVKSQMTVPLRPWHTEWPYLHFRLLDLGEYHRLFVITR